MKIYVDGIEKTSGGGGGDSKSNYSLVTLSVPPGQTDNLYADDAAVYLCILPQNSGITVMSFPPEIQYKSTDFVVYLSMSSGCTFGVSMLLSTIKLVGDDLSSLESNNDYIIGFTEIGTDNGLRVFNVGIKECTNRIVGVV